MRLPIRHFLRLLLCFIPALAPAELIKIAGKNVELTVRTAGGHGVRVTLNPTDQKGVLPENPALVERPEGEPAIRLREIEKPVRAVVGSLRVEVRSKPLTVRVLRLDETEVQTLRFEKEGGIRFTLDGQPVLGMGEGGPLPTGDWHKAKVEFDRRGRLFKMEPRWQSDAYGSRNPVPLMIGTGGWGLYFASPWGQIDLTAGDHGLFLPIQFKDPVAMRQNHANQGKQLGKGIPPMESYVEGLRDIFVFDASQPAALMKDLASISGAAAMPPKWALGYMQSHRTLEDDAQMVRIVDTFREKRIPMDAVIYLGTGFTPRGWNKPQPSFEFNPEVFKQDPAKVIADLHDRHAKVVLHMVPWDRNKLPLLDDSRLGSYWQEHVGLVKQGVDGWWPDEGDWFDLHERMKRHQLYYYGPLSTQPDRRPWSLHRNGYLGVARWGGWVWSGDTQSSWKSLETQIAVGINHSLSLSPYWGSDIGGFFSTPELTGELYARWFQFGAFCPSFRAHGRTWWTRLPWGWGLDTLGPVEDPNPPAKSELNNPEIEKIARRYAELRYQLLSYNYTLAWEARETGMPFMRALWLQDPADTSLRTISDEYLWGGDLLVAPVYEKGATHRSVRLPAGKWYDFWTGKALAGGRTITRPVDLSTLPLYVRAGALLPVDPVRQYTGEKVAEPLTVRVYRGADGSHLLYDDDGESRDYLRGESSLTAFTWNDHDATLKIERRNPENHAWINARTFRIELVPDGSSKTIDWNGEPSVVKFPGINSRK